LELEDDFEVVGVCTSLGELLDSAAAERPHLVLTDVRMPPTGTDEGIQAATTLRTTHPEIGVVVLSQYADPDYALRLVADGSRGRGYLLKEHVATPGQLVAAIHAVAGGGSYIDPQVVDVMLQARSRSSSPLGFLTAREREVLAAIATGCSNAAIAADFHVTERAVEKHINAVFSKLGLIEDSTMHRRVKAVLLFLSESAP
jgi:DNA-binding NarL/FixJ family response regulator